jgi:hypothetical protein
MWRAPDVLSSLPYHRLLRRPLRGGASPVPTGNGDLSGRSGLLTEGEVMPSRGATDG